MKKIALILCLCVLIGGAVLFFVHWHSHDGWSADRIAHWKVCTECGEVEDYGLHDFANGNQCPECQAYIYENQDGTATVEIYDEEGPRNFTGVFDKENVLLSYQRFETTYYDDGNVETMKAYGFDKSVDEAGTERTLWENSYLPYGSESEQLTYLHREIVYEADGTKINREYNQAGELVKEERS